MAISESAAALISAGIGAASTAATAGIGAAENKRAYKWTKKLYEAQSNYNLKWFSPQKQMKRLIDAGLNPHLIAGDQSVQPGGMTALNHEIPGIDLNSVANTILNYSLQKGQLDNSERAVNADVNLKRSAEQLNNSKKLAQDYTNSHLLPQQFQAGQRKITEMDQQIALFDTRRKLLESQAAYAAANARFAPSYFQFRNDKVKYDSLFREKEYNDYLDYNIRPNDPWYARQLMPFVDSLATAILNKFMPADNRKQPFWKRFFNK